MSAVLENLQAAEQARELATRQAYADLVQQLAHGAEDPTLADVEAILAGVGKAADDLAADVSHRQQREAERQKIADAERARGELDDLRAAIEAADTELEKAKAKRQSVTRPIFARIEEINCMLQLAAAARRQLMSAGYPPELDDRASVNRVNTASVEARLKNERSRARQIEENLRVLLDNPNHDRQVVAFKQSHLEKLHAEIAELESQRSELVAEMNSIVEEKING